MTACVLSCARYAVQTCLWCPLPACPKLILKGYLLNGVLVALREWLIHHGLLDHSGEIPLAIVVAEYESTAQRLCHLVVSEHSRTPITL